jgi:hypothetical protein
MEYKAQWGMEYQAQWGMEQRGMASTVTASMTLPTHLQHIQLPPEARFDNGAAVRGDAQARQHASKARGNLGTCCHLLLVGACGGVGAADRDPAEAVKL